MRAPSIRRLALRLALPGLCVAIAACGDRDQPVSPTTPTPAAAAARPPGMEVEPLRTAAQASQKLIGAAVTSALLRDGRYAGVLGRHFNYLTAEYEMKWDAIERTRGVRDFAAGDAITAVAQANGMQVKGHALIWHGSVFRQKLGDQYIADAFRAARQADPQALLFYNDYGGEGLNQKSDRIYDLVAGLKGQGVPIDGVGLQMHVSAGARPSDASIAANMSRLTSLGLLVNISEMDVRVRDVPGDLAARLEAQRAVYRSIVGVCVAEPRCDGITLWGFTDAHSWIDGQFGADDPLLFDEQYGAKPAYYGVLDALWRR